MKKLNGFEQREIIGNRYWKDPRWKKVKELRKKKKHSEANHLVFEIRSSFGAD